ncbi:HTH-type transcriptional regulator HdfR [subsurface metagenome]
MDINKLKTFYHVAKNASFTKAAYKLCITQPAVTSRIKSLEENLRTCLFRRIGRKIFLTHEGKILLEYARKTINLEKEIKTIFTELSGLQKGKIILGATRVIGTYFLPQKLGQFRAKYPQIGILTRIENSTQVMNFLLEGEVDIAISGKTDDLNKNLEAKLYHTEKLVLNTIIDDLKSKTIKERKKIKGLQPKRADVILAGTAILQVIMTRLNSDKITISDMSLRHGLMFDRFWK